MKKETKAKLVVSFAVAIVFVIGAASCNTSSSLSSAIGGATGVTKSDRDGVMYQIDDSEAEFHQVYVEGKDMD